MPLDPQIKDMLTFLGEVGAPPMWEETPAQARAGFRKLTVGPRTPEQVVPVGSVSDRTVPGAEGRLGARVYRPAGDGPFPVIAFFHGGGWPSPGTARAATCPRSSRSR